MDLIILNRCDISLVEIVVKMTGQIIHIYHVCTQKILFWIYLQFYDAPVYQLSTWILKLDPRNNLLHCTSSHYCIVYPDWQFFQGDDELSMDNENLYGNLQAPPPIRVADLPSYIEQRKVEMDGFKKEYQVDLYKVYHHDSVCSLFWVSRCLHIS